MIGGWADVIDMGSDWRKLMMMADRTGGWRTNLCICLTIAAVFRIDSERSNLVLVTLIVLH